MAFYTCVNRLGNNILYCGYDSKGNRIKERVKFKPECFVSTNDPDSEWKAIDGRSVKRIEFETLSEMKDYTETYKDVENFKIYGDINPVAQFITKQFPNQIEFEKEYMHIFNFDVEVASDDGFPAPERADKEVQSIAAKSSRKPKTFHVWGVGEYDPSIDDNIPADMKVRYVRCKDEIELLMKFIQFWKSDYPDVVTGWFSDIFDIPYIVNRIKNVLGEEHVRDLSPWGKVSYRQVKLGFNKTSDAYDIFGIQQVDYLQLFKKFGFSFGQQESYKLDHIAWVVLEEKKLSYEEYGSLTSLHDNNHQKFIEYNIKDVNLVDRIDVATGLLELAMVIAYKGGVNFVDTFGTTGIWDSFIYRYLHTQKIAIPPNERKMSRSFAGGHVKAPKIGMSEDVVSFDLNSLYPSIMVQYNMSPETIVGHDEDSTGVDYYLAGGEIPLEATEEDYAVAANGAMFRRGDKGALPTIISELYAERKVTQDDLAEDKGRIEDVKSEMRKRGLEV